MATKCSGSLIGLPLTLVALIVGFGISARIGVGVVVGVALAWIGVVEIHHYATLPLAPRTTVVADN